MPACTCGYEAEDINDLTDHLGEQFIPADDLAAGGRPHAEAARRTCLCGFTAADSTGLDTHLLATFTPPDAVGPDGREHSVVTAARARL
jgi:hypothetical protein